MSLFVTNEQIGEVHRLQKNPQFKKLKRKIGLRSEILNTQHSIQKLNIKKHINNIHFVWALPLNPNMGIY